MQPPSPDPFLEGDMTRRVATQVPAPLWTYLPSDQLWDEFDNPRPSVLREHLRKEGRLHHDDALKLIDRARGLFASEPNLLELDDPITVCGDVHGQYFDLVKLFAVGGEPPGVRYLFLGDYVDRGFFGTECCYLLFAYKICHPAYFHMIRGNHESRHLTSYFNFKEEVLFKYSEDIYLCFMACFDALPLGCILNGRFLCVHGGISPELKTIEELNAIHRFREPPSSGLFCDLLWSDPMDEEEERKSTKARAAEAKAKAAFRFPRYVIGDDEDRDPEPVLPAVLEGLFLENKLRGCSWVFSFEAVERFLKQNHLLSIIRAHEAQDEGYRLYQKSDDTGFPTVICIFSAPNYCDVYHNKASIIRFRDNLMNIRQFNASPHPYVLPHFMNAFNWSMPFVIDKILDMFRCILGLAVEDVDIQDEVIQDRMRRIKSKVRAVGRVTKLYDTVVKHRQSIIHLRGLAGGSLPRGIISQGPEAIHRAISTFQSAKDLDRESERRPPLTERWHDAKMERRLSLRELANLQAARRSGRRVGLDSPVEPREIPSIGLNDGIFEVIDSGDDSQEEEEYGENE